MQGGISRDTWKYEAGVFSVINDKLVAGMRKHDNVGTLCSAASSGCNAWAQLTTLGDDKKPFSLDRAFHAGVVLYGKDRGVDAQGVAYDELGANIPTNGRVVVFGGVRATRWRAQVEGTTGGWGHFSSHGHLQARGESGRGWGVGARVWAGSESGAAATVVVECAPYGCVRGGVTVGVRCPLSLSASV